MKKRIVIILSSIIVISTVIAGTFYFINQPNTKKPASSSDSKTPTSNNYKIEKGLEGMAKVAIPAVENYATQNLSESASSRRQRLIAYFAPDSPVFNRDLDIQTSNADITKTEAKVTSVSLSKTAEGEYPFLIVDAKVTYHFKDDTNTALQTYWIIIKQNRDGSYIANDIGIWVE